LSRPFVHLHNHSDYSLLDGAIQVKKMVAKAAEFDMPALAVTDHGNLFGAIHFYLAAKKAGIKPILGMEAYSTRGDRSERRGVGGRKPEINHLLLLCKDYEGYRNLVKLSSFAYLEGFYYKPRLDRELLRRYSKGLIATSACMSGEVNRFLSAGNLESAEQSARELQEIFGEGNFFLEVQNHGIPDEDLIRERAVDLSHKTGIPLVATNDCHYLNKGDHKAHEVLLCINTGSDIDDQHFHIGTEELYFKDGDEMAAAFPDLPEALDNSAKIAELCDLEIPLGHNCMPNFPLPEGYDNPELYLADLSLAGLKERFGKPSAEAKERLDYELDIINKMGFPGYFLITRDFIDAARDRDIAVGPGRGSAAGSLVCYSLGITDIDPLEHGLLFERFLNPERVSMPDIDIDFDYVRRGEVIDYVTDKYGKENVCQIITYGTMKARAVLRDVGRVLKLPYGEVDRIAKMVPETLGMTLEQALKLSPDLAELADKMEPWPYADLLKYALTLEGLTRHASTHAAGVIITPDPLVEHVPLYMNNKGEVLTQYDMGMCETIGLLKMDFLGLRTLTVIDDALKSINVHLPEAERIKASDIPLDDPDTFELLRRADTIGTFQLESAGMRDVLTRLQPTEFDDIIATNALFRPGPIGSGMVDDFIDRKRGRTKIVYPHADLKEILEETYGAIVYQEQVMRITSVMAGFSLGQADILRKAMGKKKVEVMAEQKVIFIDGAEAKGYDRGKAEEIFDLLAYFAGYGFNKSHSAAYAMVSMQTAWLKTHHAAEYLAACMTSEMSNTDRIVVFMNECRNHEIEVVPPDVRISHDEFRVHEGKVYFGMGAVKNVGHGAIEAIIQARESAEEESDDLYAFCESLDLRKVNKKVLESLTMAGALDALGPNRASLLACIEEALAASQSKQKEREAGQFNLLDSLDAEEQEQVRKRVPELPDWDERERLAKEKEVLGFFVSGHPLDRLRPTILALPVLNAESLKDTADRTQVRTLGIITAVKQKIDSKERTMAFLRVEDYLGSYETVVFGSVYEEYGNLLVEDAILGFEGKSNVSEAGEAKVLLDRAFSVDDALTTWLGKLHIHFAAEFEPAWVAELEQELRQHPGAGEVNFHLIGEGGNPVVIRAKGLRIEPGPWLREFLAENKDRFRCRFEGKAFPPEKKRWNGGGKNGNGKGAWARG
jgi:DNA polymerase III subunit alpha